jgi:carboxypeptidase PM20D1
MRRILKRAGAALGLALLALAALLAFNTWRFSRAAPPPYAAAAPPPATAEQLARLSAAIRIPTVSGEGGVSDPAALAAFHELLARSFPRVHASLGREVVAGHSLLYTWPGADPSLPPLLLAAHMDVVPVEPGTEARWSHPPFSGAVAGGFVWGRGAWDDKAGLLGILEAAEQLAARGFRPRRTVYLAFGHDEEIMGRGAAAIAALLRRRGVRLGLVLDEGMLVGDGIIAGMPRPVALIGVAEKGYLSIGLVARAPGGHSSMPPPEGAVVRLARAIDRVHARPMPARLSPPVAAMFDAIGPEMALPQRLALANRWLFAPLLLRTLDEAPSSSATIRTSTAATILRAGTKDNVLPQEARAVINHRLLPGDSIADVLANVRAAVGDAGVSVRALPDGQEASPVSPTSGSAFDPIRRAAARAFPGVAVAPALVIGATDARHYAPISAATYRFLPIRARPEDLPRFHGTDERISLRDYGAAIAFYRMLIVDAAGT